MRSQTAVQMPLFRGRLDSLPLFKASLAAAMKACRRSRAEIADRMNELLQAEGLRADVTEAKLSKWAAPSDATHSPSLRQLPFLLRALDSAEPLRALLEPLGLTLAGERERRLIEWAEAEALQELARERKRRARAALKEMGI